ncbi:LacI family DNA-binding transcriptional regulator [Paracoccus sp. TK19116]|uniref:LacI family DNA-binding transcriptional regulator n=1 Tax=Paracoccus albicereus TaxID=2922394 RepID=A0ABT1MTX9_9RHOB|nr:LacI family DNA-binding transcriptional regulator [Paracoccus albicereus]MCQ0971134.1 LacI family DNA-binding transcriptional regulator [Paracoccus albicereus]
MEKPSRRTTIYDIAELAKASPSAVSSVLNGTWKKRRISAKLAERVMKLAEKQGYAVNAQASLLRREKSNVIGMIVPKYDNRYFGQIAERFEEMARDRGLFPVVTCTQRDPDLEFEAAKELVSWQADCVISTGATDPDRISAFCAAAGVQALNLDLPGKAAPSVVSDNFAGARTLTALILDRCNAEFGDVQPLRFVGGRLSDHNTAQRLKGFLQEHQARGIEVPETHILATGYSATKSATALADFRPQGPTGLFVNSTIALEGVVKWLGNLGAAGAQVRYGCFDWDPFGRFLPGNVGMVEQDVDEMMTRVLALVGETGQADAVIHVPCRLHVFGAA